MNHPFTIAPEKTTDQIREIIDEVLSEAIWGLKPGKYEVKIGKPLRTNPQNRRYWKRIVVAFSESTGYELLETHQLLAKRFLAYEKIGKSGKVQLFAKSTTELNTKEFCDYNDQCERWGAEFGLIFKDEK